LPRISVPGYSTPFPIAPRRLPSPDDLIDAARLGRRLATLAAALDDLPRQAKRFARWRACRDAIIAQDRNRDATAAPTGEPRRRGKPQRIWPLRRGQPPGSCRRPQHEIHEILKDLHSLAFWALERRDTS
jgi:hypothetical protein